MPHVHSEAPVPSPDSVPGTYWIESGFALVDELEDRVGEEVASGNESYVDAACVEQEIRLLNTLLAILQEEVDRVLRLGAGSAVGTGICNRVVSRTNAVHSMKEELRARQVEGKLLEARMENMPLKELIMEAARDHSPRFHRQRRPSSLSRKLA
jgi:hypothetical protein